MYDRGRHMLMPLNVLLETSLAYQLTVPVKCNLRISNVFQDGRVAGDCQIRTDYRENAGAVVVRSYVLISTIGPYKPAP